LFQDVAQLRFAKRLGCNGVVRAHVAAIGAPSGTLCF
jgi:hypothetical protein